jgi:F0F1-type ATP synthase membrane subunit b/b'
MNSEKITNHNQNIKTSLTEVKKPLQKESSSAGLLEIDGTIVCIALSFVIFTVIMQKIFYGPVTKIRKKRADFIKGIIDETKASSDETEILSLNYTQKIREARKQTAEKTSLEITQANAQKTKILEEKKQEITEQLSRQRLEIQREKEDSANLLRCQISQYALDISKKILGEEFPLACACKEFTDISNNR